MAMCKQRSLDVYFTPEVVRALLEKNFEDYRPPMGDMYTRHHIQPFTQQDKYSRVAEITKNMLVQTAITTVNETKSNASRNIEIIKYTGGADGLCGAPVPKLKNKHPFRGQFNMNY